LVSECPTTRRPGLRRCDGREREGEGEKEEDELKAGETIRNPYLARSSSLKFFL